MLARTSTLAAALALCTLLLGGCGSGHTTANTSGGPPKKGPGASAATGTTGKPSARARREAIALARAIDLRPADVPGFGVSSSHEHEATSEKRLEHELLRCVGGLSADTQVAELSSHAFERQVGMRAEGVQSGVTVQRTPALAARELEVIHGPRVHTCLTHYLDLLLAGRRLGPGRMTPVSISQGTPPASGAAGSFAFRIRSTIVTRGVAIPIYFDLLGFVVGPVQVTLFTDGLPQPFPAATEEKLFLLLLARAKAHAGQG